MPNSIPQFFPSVFYSGAVRIDSPASHVAFAYEEDRKFFAQHKRRKMYLRTIWPGEFGMVISYAPRPFKVHIVVIQLSTGKHLVMPCFVGASLSSGNETTDSEIESLLIEMNRLGGIDPAEWEAFTRSVRSYLTAPQPTVNDEGIQ
jgi:hypothetical protein